jgi:hypothetical protein
MPGCTAPGHRIESLSAAEIQPLADQYQLVACECAQALHGVPYTPAM